MCDLFQVFTETTFSPYFLSSRAECVTQKHSNFTTFYFRLLTDLTFIFRIGEIFSIVLPLALNVTFSSWRTLCVNTVIAISIHRYDVRLKSLVNRKQLKVLFLDWFLMIFHCPSWGRFSIRHLRYLIKNIGYPAGKICHKYVKYKTKWVILS